MIAVAVGAGTCATTVSGGVDGYLRESLGKSQTWLWSLCPKLFREAGRGIVPDPGLADTVDVVADNQHALVPAMKERHRCRKMPGTLQIDDDYVSG